MAMNLRPERPDGKSLTAPLGKRRKESSKLVPQVKTSKLEHANTAKQKSTVLSDWIIKPLPDSRGVCVEGQKEGFEDFWHSTAIVEAKKPKLVVTVSGSVYKLKGKINKLCTVDNGFPKDVANAFANGFPKNWREIIQDFYTELEESISIQAECSPQKSSKIQKLKSVKKRKLVSSSTLTEGEEDSPHSAQSIWTPAGLLKQEMTSEEVTVTRSGRMSLPPLAGWVGQHYSRVPGTSAIQVTFATDFAEKTLNKTTKDILRLSKTCQKMVNHSKLSKSLLVPLNSSLPVNGKDKKNMTLDCPDQSSGQMMKLKTHHPTITERFFKDGDANSKFYGQELTGSMCSKDIKIVLEDCSKSLDEHTYPSLCHPNKNLEVDSEKKDSQQPKPENDADGSVPAGRRSSGITHLSGPEIQQGTAHCAADHLSCDVVKMHPKTPHKSPIQDLGNGLSESLRRSSRGGKQIQISLNDSSVLSVDVLSTSHSVQHNGKSRRPILKDSDFSNTEEKQSTMEQRKNLDRPKVKKLSTKNDDDSSLMKLDTFLTDNNATKSNEICVVKKKRGRPSKSSESKVGYIPTDVSVTKPQATSVVKRKRGRPPRSSKNKISYTPSDLGIPKPHETAAVKGKGNGPANSAKRKISYSPTYDESPQSKGINSSSVLCPQLKPQGSQQNKRKGKPVGTGRAGSALNMADTKGKTDEASNEIFYIVEKRTTASEKGGRKRKQKNSFAEESEGLNSSKKTSSETSNKRRKIQKDDQSWSEKEKRLLHRAISEVNAAEKFYWSKVSAVVGTRSEEECQEFYKKFLESRMAERTKTGGKKAQTNKKGPARQKGEPIRGGKGTLKRKQDLRDFLDEQNEGYQDNIFDSTPFVARNSSSLFPGLGVDFDLEDGDEFWAKFKGLTPSSALATPGVRLKARLASAKKTPACSSRITLTTPHSVNRRDADRYIKAIMDHKKKQAPVQVIPEVEIEVDEDAVLPVKSIFAPVTNPSIIIDGHSLNAGNDEDDEEEEDSPYMYYWNDDS